MGSLLGGQLDSVEDVVASGFREVVGINVGVAAGMSMHLLIQYRCTGGSTTHSETPLVPVVIDEEENSFKAKFLYLCISMKVSQMKQDLFLILALEAANWTKVMNSGFSIGL